MRAIQNLEAYKTLMNKIEPLRQRDPLICGVQLTGLLAIGSVASWLFPCSSMTRVGTSLVTLGLATFYGKEEGPLKVITDYFPKALGLTRSMLKADPQFDPETGIWFGSGKEVRWSQFFDPNLAEGMAQLFKKIGIGSVWDFGCGRDEYSRFLSEKGIIAKGLDGNPQTDELSGGLAEVQDLTKPFDKEQRDCVISLEVGDKIPQESADQLIENMVKHAKDAIIISWAVKNQKGPNHLNSQDNSYVKDKLAARGWEYDDQNTQTLRKASHPIYYWFQDSLMVFRKKGEENKE